MLNRFRKSPLVSLILAGCVTQSQPASPSRQPAASPFSLARLTGHSGKKVRRAVLLLVFSFLVLACSSANAGNETSADDNRIVLENPTPQLSANSARSLLATQIGGLDSAGYVLVIVRLEAGKAMEVRSLMSSGSLLADKEICQFVLDPW